jgi:hypothetical protein
MQLRLRRLCSVTGPGMDPDAVSSSLTVLVDGSEDDPANPPEQWVAPSRVRSGRLDTKMERRARTLPNTNRECMG